MKRSNKITLVMFPVIMTTAACQPDNSHPTSKYDSYTSLEDCLKEWPLKACDVKTHPETGEFIWVGPPYTNNKPSYVDSSGQTHERKFSHGVPYVPVIIPHYAGPPNITNTPQDPTRPSISSRSTSTYTKSHTAPTSVSRGGFGSTATNIGATASS